MTRTIERHLNATSCPAQRPASSQIFSSGPWAHRFQSLAKTVSAAPLSIPVAALVADLCFSRTPSLSDTRNPA
eukprot:1240836-Pleurochrysis_carterae.AAC.1